ncbi:hypothetical protein [Salinivibrio socompensis]|uniref:hypothetical protein n=1 Tax=Salinivibrio socompensis TaxID=1510206 RepID=UPI0004B119CB|nr:hypothetical protein [Salinivibrio socompensis]
MITITLITRGRKTRFLSHKEGDKTGAKRTNKLINMQKQVIHTHLSTAIHTERELAFFWGKILEEGLIELGPERRESVTADIESQPTLDKAIKRLSVIIDKERKYSLEETGRFLKITKEKLYCEKLKNYDFINLCNEDRKINWLWCYIRKNSKKWVSLLRYKEPQKGIITEQFIPKTLVLDDRYLKEKRPNTTEEKRKQIENCLIFSPSSEEEEKMLSNHFKNEWLKNSKRNEMIKWLDGCRYNQLIWAYAYIRKKEEIAYTWTPSSNEDIKTVIVAFYDLTPENDKKQFIDRFRRTWNTKKHRNKKRGNTLEIENKVLDKLDRLAEETQSTPQDVIKKLINTMDWDEILDILESE